MKKKTCSKCKTELTIKDFYCKGGGNVNLQSICKKCTSEIAKEMRITKKLSELNISRSEYDALIEQNSEKCSCCNQIESITSVTGVPKNLIISKNVKTNELQLLCSSCDKIKKGMTDDKEVNETILKYMIEQYT